MGMHAETGWPVGAAVRSGGSVGERIVSTTSPRAGPAPPGACSASCTRRWREPFPDRRRARPRNRRRSVNLPTERCAVGRGHRLTPAKQSASKRMPRARLNSGNADAVQPETNPLPGFAPVHVGSCCPLVQWAAPADSSNPPKDSDASRCEPAQQTQCNAQNAQAHIPALRFLAQERSRAWALSTRVEATSLRTRPGKGGKPPSGLLPRRQPSSRRIREHDHHAAFLRGTCPGRVVQPG